MMYKLIILILLKLMARRCSIDVNKKTLSGNNVSHSNRKTRRIFLPNIQMISFFSDILQKNFKLRIASKTIRSIEHNGGLDSYLLNTGNSKLTTLAKKIKSQLLKNSHQAS